MRRRRAAQLSGLLVLLVLVLAVGAAPSATAADPPSNQLLWVATSTETQVFDRTTQPPTLVNSLSDAPTGSFVRMTVVGADRVFASTQTGIDVFDAQTGQYVFGMGQGGSGYVQLAALQDGSKLYGLRSGRTVVDVFGPDSFPLATISLPGVATYMSDARPPDGDVILLGSILDQATQTYVSGAIDTATDHLTTFSPGSTRAVTGTVWSHDGSTAYLSAVDRGSPSGAIGRFHAPNQLTYTSTGYAPQQVTLSPDGTRLFVPWTGPGGTRGVRGLDAGTLADVQGFPYATTAPAGISAMAPDGRLYLASGLGAGFGSVTILATAGGPVTPPLEFDHPVVGDYVSAKVAAVQVTSGADQKMYVGRVFDDRAVATVVDAAGLPVSNQMVQWSVSPTGAATLQGCVLCYSRTGADGTTSSPFIVAGDSPGGFSVVATPVQGAPGATSAQFPMTILPAAVPPTVTALAGGDGQVRVTFTPGDDRGISPPTSFTVTATDHTNPANGGQTATGTASPITVTGLTNGDSYSFAVTANTPEGDWTSAPSAQITVGIPASISGTPPPGEVGKPYTFTFTITGVPAPVVGFDPAGTPLPAGLSFDSQTATISGTPTAVEQKFLFITATNALASAQTTPTLVVNPAGTVGGSEPTPTPTSTTTPPPTGTGAAPPANTSVNAASRSLAATGMPVDRLVGGAALLVLVGGSLVLLARRRRTS